MSQPTRRCAIFYRNIRVNRRIRAPRIRLIGSDGKQIGIVSVEEGLSKAQEAGLDLVEISPTADPPVCRILEFGKYLYTLEKQEKEARKKQHVITIKEVKLGPNIEDHDYQTKLRSAIGFLERGDKVKVSVMLRGREASKPELGHRVVDRFAQDLSDISEPERVDGPDRRTIVRLLTPKAASRKSKTSHSPQQADGKKENNENAQTQNEQSGSQPV